MEGILLKKEIIIAAVFVLLFLATVPFASGAAEKVKTLAVMFVHDTHSHLKEFSTLENGEEHLLGGFAKMKTLIKEQKAKDPHTLLLDAGDFSMGTLIQVIYEQEASELRMLGQLGFDVTTLGNHEFDYRSVGLANMLRNAADSKERLPELVLCNVDWEAMKKAGLSGEQKLLYDAFAYYGVKDYTVVQKGDVKVAVIGVFGQDALECAPTCVLQFRDPVKAVKETVKEIQANEAVDMIACVSHSGVWEDEEKSEDELLAKNVPELDLIISGHTHTRLMKPIVHGDTYIVSAEEYGKYIGNLSMTQKENGRWEMSCYDLIPIDETVIPDIETQETVNQFMELADSSYLKQFGYTREQVLCSNAVEFAPQAATGELHTEVNLGSIIADAYTYAAEKYSEDKHPVDVTVVPSGTIRDTYTKGEITTEDVFNSFSLGIGEDGIPGYPLISVYLTGAELKTAAEIDASISDMMTTARLYTDGLYWHYNPNRMILNKVTEVYLVDQNGQRVELEDEKLYRVVTDYYTSQMLGGVTEMSYGLLSLVPKFADGTPVENYAETIITTEKGELKAWAAIADYMTSFTDNDGDGLGDVPEKYGTKEGRKVVEDSRNFMDLIRNPNRFFFMITGIVLLLIVLLVSVIVLIVKIVKKKKTGNRKNKKEKKQQL